MPLSLSESPFPHPGLDLMTQVPTQVAGYGCLEWSTDMDWKVPQFMGKDACLISNVCHGHGLGGVMLHMPCIYHP